MSKMTRMAHSMREAAHQYLKKGELHWKHDPVMMGMIRDDTQALYQVAMLIEMNRIDQAAAHAESLDTAVRDVIPDDVWEYLHEV